MTNEVQAGLISAAALVVGAILTLVGVWLTTRSSERAVNTSSPAASFAAISGGFQQLVDDLREQHRQDRVDLKGALKRIEWLEDRVRRNHLEATTAEDKCFRNIRVLQDHIGTCCDMMRGAGLTPPDDPKLET